MEPVRDVEYIEAEDVRRSPFRVAVTPLPSLNFAVRDAVGAGRSATPEAWCRAIRGHLRRQDYETLSPLTTPGQTLVPDPLVGCSEPPGRSFKEGIEHLMATPVDSLGEEIEYCSAASGNMAWDDAKRDPARWLRRYVACLLRAWKGFGPLWRVARPALDREIERVGMATALDAQLELLDGLLASGGVDDGRWYFPCKFHEGRVRFPDAGVVLLPLVAGERSSIIARRDDAIEAVSYPLRSVLGLEPLESPSACLEGLLGTPRTRILRALAQPTTIGRVAEALRLLPSAATHHVGALEAAGLVVRDRHGRHVIVRRTRRGEALLEIYDELERDLGRSARSSR
jgi:DNA-binding transcriptional ArsR family regulator